MIGAIDIGGTKIAVGLVDEDGRVHARTRLPTDLNVAPRVMLERVRAALRELSAGATLRGVGIGCTGPVDPLTGCAGTIDLLPGWEGVDLVAPFVELGHSAALCPSAALENDADAAALGEAAWGAGRGAERFIYVTISTGIGAGLVFDGHLYRGARGSHPEIGHHILDASGPRCYCGAPGCWEVLASGPALASAAGLPTAEAACDAARQGDPAARAAVERVGNYIGLGLANLITLYGPDVIALGGGVMASYDLFAEKIRATVAAHTGLMPADLTRIVPAHLDADAGLIGAARVWIHRYAS